MSDDSFNRKPYETSSSTSSAPEKAEGEDWFYAGATVEPSQRERAILRLSRGGSDAVVLRDFDIPFRSFVAGGYGFLRRTTGRDG